MKRIILSALILLSISASAFSRNSGDDEKNILNSFNKSFSNAKEVKVESQNKLVKVTFVIDGQKMFAYYQHTGEQVAVTRYLKISQLPINLSIGLKEKISGKWLTDLFEVNANGETSYYATMVDDSHTIIYIADASGSWSVFKKTKRDNS